MERVLQTKSQDKQSSSPFTNQKDRKTDKQKEGQTDRSENKMDKEVDNFKISSLVLYSTLLQQY